MICVGMSHVEGQLTQLDCVSVYIVCVCDNNTNNSHIGNNMII